MRFLGRYLTQGTLQSVIGVSLLTLLSMFITPLAYFISGTPLGLITLRKGAQAGLQIAIGSLFVISLLLVMGGLPPALVLSFAVGIWLPVWLGSSVLRVTQSQGLMLAIAGGMAMMFIVLMHFSIENVTDWWREMMLAWLEQMTTPDKVKLLQPAFQEMAPFMNGFMAAGIVSSVGLTVILARWWQACLFNPHGFRQEFLSLQLPKVLLLMMAVCAAVVFAGLKGMSGIARDFLMVIVCLYVFQGVSFVHGFVHRKGLASAWLIGMYLAFPLMFVQTVIFLACLGVVDSVLGPNKPEPPPADDS